ncbi:MAG: DNA-binding protein WhiA [Clostridia bacterium]|nr:DNA-binding protein WhiA [Clostridia bacterium]
MSFSQETKSDLCGIPVKKLCCKRALLYGMLLCGNLFSPEMIRLVTENERVSQSIVHLLREVYGARAGLTIGEKKTKNGVISSYRIAVSSKEDLIKIFMDLNLPPDCETAINPSLFICEDCVKHFLRGCFLTAGMLTDPQNGYRLELIFESEPIMKTVGELLSAYGLSPKYTGRKASFVLYFKESEEIEDLLTFIGASRAALAIMNAKIFRDIRNTQNRRANCDAANISKMTLKAQQYIRAIRTLRELGLFDGMNEELKTTALLRLDDPEASLADLAARHDPPITKSGVNHRLIRICEYCRRVEEQKQKKQ